MLSRKNFQHPWFAIITLALSIFTVVSTEMLPIGLLSSIADTFNVSIGDISLAVSIPAFIAMITAPLMLLMFSKVDRKKLLIILMALLFLSNTLSALAPNVSVLLFARILLGFSIGGVWTIVGGLAHKIITPSKVTLATSIIFGGVSAAYVFGIPLGVFLGELSNWQFAFSVMAGLSALLLLLLIICLPSLPSTESFQLVNFKHVFQISSIYMGLLITLLLVIGQFMSYTFIRPLLEINAGFSNHSVSSLLFIYGLIGIIGNFVLGNLVGKHLKLTIALISILLTISLLALQFVVTTKSLTILVLLVWGFAYGAVSVCLMVWMVKSAPKNIEIATALYISTFNLAIACGAFFGGKTYDLMGIHTTLLVASILTIIPLFLLAFNKKKDENP